jgi:P pilus assembly chaperone PapD
MFSRLMTTSGLLLSCATLVWGISLAALAADAPRGVNIGDTRLIYNAGKKGISTEAVNNDPNPYLVQSWVEDGNGTRSTNFIITPPLFRLDGGKSTRLRITQSGTLPGDRETVSWLVVRFVPPASTTKKESDNSLQLSIRIRIKLFYRPEGLPGTPEMAGKALRWTRQGNDLVATNSGAYSVSLAGVRLGGKAISDGLLVQPKSAVRVPLKGPVLGQIVYGVINDFGGVKSYTQSLPNA